MLLEQRKEYTRQEVRMYIFESRVFTTLATFLCSFMFL